jgi:PKD repeat protein
MRFKLTVLLLFVLCHLVIAQEETPLSGIINIYAAVSEVDECSNALTVDDPTGFQAGDQVILIQMQGASVHPGENSTDPDFGVVEDIGAAGLYEKNRIVSLNGNRIVLERQLLYDYDPQNALQLVSMPVFENAITVDTLKAEPWDGTKGGIVAFEVLGELKVDAPITTAGQGFRGGEAIAINDNRCSWNNPQGSFYFNKNNWRGSPKGESISRFITDREWGRGSQANGGGGGNDHNSGGGGGANITEGGIGGRNEEPGFFNCKGTDPGLGGRALIEEEGRVYMGGGGGSGHSNNTVAAIGGGNGGGIIMIKASIITRLFGGIYADGQSVGTAEGDGAGGAGAGGTILLEADSLSNDILVHAFGGNGGTVSNVGINSDRCFGPGGGGAGGRILLTQMVSLPNTGFQVTGGQAGRSINSNSCPDGNNGATPGENGAVRFFSGLAESQDTASVLSIVNQPTLVEACVGNPVLLEVEADGTNLTYQWQINRGSGFEDLSNDATFSGTQTAILSITEANNDILNADFRLQIEDGCGEQLTSEVIQLEEGDLPDVNFSLSVNNLVLTVNSITPENAGEYLWDFGDGNTSEEKMPTHTYAQSGTYDVKVIVRNACGVDSLAQFVPIINTAGPTADFSYQDTTGCAPVSVQFQNASSSDAASFQWTFLEGSPATSMEENPRVEYETAGSYQVRLIVADINGMADTLIQTFNVVVTPSPIADFQFLASGLEVSFENLSLNADTFTWDFGDGSAVSSEAAPTHVFPETGAYFVQLIAVNDCSRDTLSTVVEVEAPPGANFVIESIEGCSPVVVTFQNTTTGDYDRLAWSFQNGTPDFSTEENPVVTYSETGSYEVVLAVFNEGGSTTASQVIDIEIIDPPVADFNLQANNLRLDIQNNAQNADSLCWLIEQDTGLVEEVVGPLSQYVFESPGTYQISQIAKSKCGADTLTQTIAVNTAPLANFEWGTTAGCSPLAINLRNTSVFADSYEWIFEGGIPATSTDPEPVVTYTESGSYDWTLIAVNASGRDTVRQTVQVELLAQPVADFEQAQTDILSLSLKSMALEADSLCWIVEDEVFPRTALDSFFSYTFPSPGTYNYGLIAKNECGADTLVRQTSLSGIPIPEMTVVVDSGCAPLRVEVSSPFFSPPLDQYWIGLGGSNIEELTPGDFQDGVGVTFTTGLPDVIQIRLRVGSQYGEDVLILDIPVDIAPFPVANFDFTNTGRTVDFNNQSSDADDVLWDFGDGNISRGANPSHTYTELGDYDVSLIASNDCGLDTLVQNIRVNSAPVAAFNIEKNGDCAPLQIRLTDQSQGLDNTVSYNFAGIPVVAIDEANGIYEISESGDLSITMRVENELGVDELIQNISVGIAPVAVFASQVNGLSVTFEDQSTGADEVQWLFGDGSTSQERSPTHQYAAEGEYTVQMIVENDCGLDTLTRTITVGEALVARFIAVNSFGCAPHLVQFRNRSTGNVSSIEWSFLGGTPSTSSDPEPQVLYTEIGTYPVTLTINGPLGSSTETIDEMIEIVTFPKADFNYEVDGFQVRFTNRSENAEGYRWDFGDGTTSEEENPVHTYTRGGVFSVTLNATIATCGSSVTMDIPVMLSDAEDVFASEDLTVYPNPARDRLFIDSWSPGVYPLSFELISSQGQLLIRQQLNHSGQIDLQAFPSGLYYIRMSSEKKQWVGKLIKID